MMIVLGSDHAGFELKKHLKSKITDLGHEVLDVGCYSLDSADYPDIAEQAALKVLEQQRSLGVLICGSGQGMAIAANKIPGIRAVVCSDPYSARVVREHNDANVLALGSRVIGTGLAEAVLESFLKSEFAGGRHQRRVDIIKNLEKKYQTQGGAVGGLY